MTLDTGGGAPMAGLARRVQAVPGFPRPGVLFRDITPLLADPADLAAAVDGMAAPFRGSSIDVVAGVEARGFILAAPIAISLDAGFVPVRKQGRLPRATLSRSYALEYGEATLEIHADAVSQGARVLIVDDVLATGGTALAAAQLVEDLGGAVVGLSFLLELVGLEGARTLGGRRYAALLTF